MYKLPTESIANARGSWSDTVVAARPSPGEYEPPPATVVIVPAATFRMTLLSVSAI